MKALITGSGGFVGKHLMQYLRSEGDEVFGTIQDQKEKTSEQQFILDIRDEAACKAIIAQVAPDVIYHLAGISFVPEAEQFFDKTLSINVAGTTNVLSACRGLTQKPRFIFVSSSEIYGKVAPEFLPISEDQLPAPANNYSLSKRMAELVVERFTREQVVQGVIARPFNHIGPGQDPRFVVSAFADQLAQIAKAGARGRIHVGNLEALRDFTDVRDIVRAYRLAASSPSPSVVYNFGSGVAVAIQEILTILIEISQCDVEIVQDPSRMRGPEVKELRCDASKAKRELGWERTFSLRDSLRAIFESCLAQ